MATKVIVFGEDDNDRRALVHLIHAILSDVSLAEVKPIRRPIVLARNAEQSGKRRDMATDIAAFWRAEARPGLKLIVVAHRDCDRLEPAHVAETSSLEEELRRAGVPDPVAATPAWEIEAWWMLFPEALARTRGCWRRVNFSGHVGSIADAKERLTRDLRPIGKAERRRCPDFVESDGIRVAEEVRKVGIAAGVEGRSHSFRAFRQRLREVAAT